MAFFIRFPVYVINPLNTKSSTTRPNNLFYNSIKNEIAKTINQLRINHSTGWLSEFFAYFDSQCILNVLSVQNEFFYTIKQCHNLSLKQGLIKMTIIFKCTHACNAINLPIKLLQCSMKVLYKSINLDQKIRSTLIVRYIHKESKDKIDSIFTISTKVVFSFKF